uniref:Uncharacterized protein AlNc14C53G4135 n=1 Tax=Albugo laibachii Nc14 TaxID=890382 RepID=F0WBU4_9STRA|nr:conserved hypothetical protein [Albugo laibachii Nc14]|eukprot:CCA18621.1 conserved hypothetical protein [Albugo laibachii Nc14]
MDSIASGLPPIDTVEIIHSIALHRRFVADKCAQLEENDAIIKWKWDQVMTGGATYQMEFYDHITSNVVRDVLNGRNSCILSIGLDSSLRFRTLFGNNCRNSDASYEPERSDQISLTDSEAFIRAMEDHGQLGLILLQLFQQYESSVEESPNISLCFWMLSDDTTIDLLRPNPQEHPREINPQESIPHGITSITIRSSDIFSTLQQAKLNRAIQIKQRIANDDEGSMHYFCAICIQSETKSTTLSIVDLADFKSIPKERSNSGELDEVRKVMKWYKAQADEEERSKSPVRLDMLKSSGVQQLLLALTTNSRTFLHLNAIDNNLDDAFSKEIIDLLAVSSSITDASGEKSFHSASSAKITANFDRNALVQPEKHYLTEKGTPSSSICDSQDAASDFLQPKQDVKTWLEVFTQQKLEILGGELDVITPIHQLEHIRRSRHRQRTAVWQAEAEAQKEAEEAREVVEEEARTIPYTFPSDPIKCLRDEALREQSFFQENPSAWSAPIETSSSDLNNLVDDCDSVLDSRLSIVRPTDTSLEKDNALLRQSFHESHIYAQPAAFAKTIEEMQSDPRECEYPMDSLCSSKTLPVSKHSKNIQRTDTGMNSGSGGEIRNAASSQRKPQQSINGTTLAYDENQAKISSSKERILRRNYDALLQIVQEQQKLRQLAQTDAQESKLREQETKTLLEIQMENLKLEIVALKRKLRMHEQTSNWAKVFDDYECEIERQKNCLSRLQDENTRLEMRLATMTYEDNHKTRSKPRSALPLNMKKKLQQWFQEKQQAQKELELLRKKERHFHIHQKLLNEATRKVEELSREIEGKEHHLHRKLLGEARLSADREIAAATTDVLHQEVEKLSREKAKVYEELEATKQVLSVHEAEKHRATLLETFLTNHGDRLGIRCLGSKRLDLNQLPELSPKCWNYQDRRKALTVSVLEAGQKLTAAIKKRMPSCLPIVHLLTQTLNTQELRIQELSHREIDFVQLLLEMCSDTPELSLKYMIQSEMTKISEY